MHSTGQHNDTECKISAFGNNFIFTMSGLAFKPGAWNAHDVAREAWKRTPRTGRPIEDVSAIGHEWITEMESRYTNSVIIEDVEKRNPGGDPVLANAVFAASDPSGGIALLAVNIDYDRGLYNSTRQIKLTHDGRFLLPPYRLYGGHSEIVEEFDTQSSVRAEEYMTWFWNQISNQSIPRRRAMTAAKLIELSILLHPKNVELGFPIDVLQLDKATGVHWIQRKKNCPSD